jgi:hypothetical protein
VGIEVLGAAPGGVADGGCGRGEAHPARTDDIRNAEDHEVGVVSVQVQLPQVRQPEDVGVSRRTVYSDADVGHGRWLVEMNLDPFHGEKLPVVVNRTHPPHRA